MEVNKEDRAKESIAINRLLYLKDGNGRMRRVHKRYVDVVAHVRDDGFLEPLSIAWRDGRTFRVRQVIEVGSSALASKVSSRLNTA